ncbi:hypothetical protein B0T25DRAFT_541148 [Lasiosphaeria hispida]|uniref:Uncharacterized protein n=1 Tax=Lasiosphaeria hispida TaxID=260671 RepID=A0AAJ0HNN9_9PEZI|nr:hypothetical protein B0T25DRAFT_541148 [Lasiosphaeria hispida]
MSGWLPRNGFQLSMAPIRVITAGIAYKRQDPNLQCSPATAWSIFIFFTSNYLAHCATVKMYPGSSTTDTLVATVLALFLPSSGIIRALHSIARNSWFKKHRNPLEKAAMAGALRMVVRDTYWSPREGDCIKPVYPRKLGVSSLPTHEGAVLEEAPPPSHGAHGDAVSRNNEIETTAAVIPEETGDDVHEKSQQRPIRRHLPIYKVHVEGAPEGMRGTQYLLSAPLSSINHASKDHHTMHGKALLPPGYSWAEVPAEAEVSFAAPQNTEGSPPSISSNYNWVQSLVGLFQAGSAGLTLYRSRGDQIERYGYAAFGLTVIPYLIMSVFNLVAQIATADYPTFYMVSSPEMKEARRRGGVFDGAVGTLVVDEWDGKADKREPVYQARFAGSGNPGGVEVTKMYGDGSLPPVTIKGLWSRSAADGDIRIPKHTTFKLHKYPSSSFRKWSFLYFVLPILLGCLSLVVVGALTHFKNGESSNAQRAWIMSWLVVGIACGWWADVVSGMFIPERDMETGKIGKCFYVCQLLTCILFLGIFCAPAIGGFLTVAKMLGEYGICESG